MIHQNSYVTPLLCGGWENFHKENEINCMATIREWWNGDTYIHTTYIHLYIHTYIHTHVWKSNAKLITMIQTH